LGDWHQTGGQQGCCSEKDETTTGRADHEGLQGLAGRFDARFVMVAGSPARFSRISLGGTGGGTDAAFL
jgi:hypothetical protein